MQFDDRAIYEPSGWVWLACGSLFPIGVWLNMELEQGPLSPLALIPFAVVVTALYPASTDRKLTHDDRMMGRRGPRRWWSARSDAQWVAASRRAFVALLIMLALFALEAAIR